MTQYEGDERRACYKETGGCPHASEAAENAVKKVFAILGVNVDDPEKVEEFRKSLRWSDVMRRRADHGFLVIVGLIAAAVATAITSHFGGGK